MMNNKWIKQCRTISGLCFLLYVGVGNALASSWQDEPAAQQQLHQVGLELALADVHPKLTLWWQQATNANTASDVADDRLLLGIQSFWRHWVSLSFIERQHLRTHQADLSYTDKDYDNLQLASQLQRRVQLVEGITPNFANYSQLQQQLAHLLEQKQTDWPALRSATVRPGDRLPVVERIRERLRILGDMPKEVDLDTPLVPDVDGVPDIEVELDTERELQEPIPSQGTGRSLTSVRDSLQTEVNSTYASSTPASREFIDPLLYDAKLERAVRSFQQRHGLTVDGVIGPNTYQWLDATPLARAQLLMRSMMRTLISDELPSSYLLVNIPEYHMRLYQNQVMVLESNIIVGRDKRRTPIMESKITNVVFNPPWNVPRSIINKDIVPKLYRDPSYIERQGFDVLEGGNKVPSDVWQTRLEEGGGFPYHLRQRPGRGNALGAYKFHLPTTNAIYLHDTPSRGLFGRDSRALSSGCVRVEGAEQLANWLVEERLGRRKLAALKAKPTTTWVKVTEPLPLFMVYWPGWLSADGIAHYRKDIYQYDKHLTSPF
ncbi:MAG: L,D-transpeptidase family protein [Oceanisphaera sp.]|uniref:L,D-transpeptidase family protein n=1 Tax=Oceanisphaera sp. TaxID=1929979 RepID=UPI003F999E9C